MNAQADVLTQAQYLAAYPRERESPISTPGNVEVLFIRVAGEMVDWICPYPGDYLKVFLQVQRAGGVPCDKPWRVYIADHDDWCVARRFTTEAEAREVLALLTTGPIGHDGDLLALMFRPD